MKVLVSSCEGVRLVTVKLGADASHDCGDVPQDTFSFAFYMTPDEAEDFADTLQRVAKKARNACECKRELEIV